MRMIISGLVGCLLGGLVGCLLGGLALLGIAVNHFAQLGQSRQAGMAPPELSVTSFAFWGIFFVAGLYYLIRGIRDRRRAKRAMS